VVSIIIELPWISETMKAVEFSGYDKRLVNLINENPI
jgi:hypothetical protein